MHRQTDRLANGAHAGPATGHRRLRHLDGLRGVAILLVLLGHTVHKAQDDVHIPFVVRPFLNAEEGVLIFFVLSGYLITSILLRERERTGAVRLRRFYVRRTLRIWPALYVYVAVVLILAATTSIVVVTTGQTVAALTFTWNYNGAAGGWWLGHVWSLSVEEQFYLLWPLLLVAVKPRTALRLALVGFAVAPLIRVSCYVLDIGEHSRLPLYFHTRYDALLIGAAVALVAVVHPKVNARLVATAARYRLDVLAVVLFVLSGYADGRAHGTYGLSVGLSLEAACSAVLLLAVQRDGWLRRGLSFRPLVYLGVISYSLYLWQQLFLAYEWKGQPVIGVLALGPLLAIGAAVISQRCVEAPFLRLKTRFEPPAVVSADGGAPAVPAPPPSSRRGAPAGIR